MEPVAGSVIHLVCGDEEPAPVPSRPRRSGSRSPAGAARKRESRDSLETWLARRDRPAITIAAIALFAPNGCIAGCAVLAIGMVMVLVGFGAGAYGEFHEDFLYGFLYMVIPFYTAYYMVTRWDDLWIWFACSTSGVGLVLLGTEMARWGGVVAERGRRFSRCFGRRGPAPLVAAPRNARRSALPRSWIIGGDRPAFTTEFPKGGIVRGPPGTMGRKGGLSGRGRHEGEPRISGRTETPGDAFRVGDGRFPGG